MKRNTKTRIFNQTSFPYGLISGQRNYPTHSLTVIAKATFNISPDGLVPADEQIAITGDQFVEDGDPNRAPLIYESDLAPWKPRADLLLVGKCFAPDRVGHCDIHFQVGDTSATYRVSGDRSWESTAPGFSITQPIPFVEMDLSYDRSYGGEENQENPVGVGRFLDDSISLPNIEDISQPMVTPQDHISTVGFGPINRQWPVRQKLMGSFDSTNPQWPWFPPDLDWSYFNAAPKCLQADYLIGNEALMLRNLITGHPNYQCRLPGVRVRAFFEEHNHTMDQSFREVPLAIDTLWINTTTNQLVLVWRGCSDVSSEEYNEISFVYLFSESVDQHSSLEDCRLRLEKCKQQDEEKWNPPLEEPDDNKDESIDDESASPDSSETDHIDQQLAELKKYSAQLCAQSGIDPDNPPELSEEEKEQQKEILEELGISDELIEFAKEDQEEVDEDESEWTRADVLEHYNLSGDFGGEDLTAADLSELDLSTANFKNAILADANLSGANLDGCNFELSDLSGAAMVECRLNQCNLKNADLTSADLSRACLNDSQITEAVFVDADMRRTKMNNCDSRKANFSQADLSEATLAGSTFLQCDFSEAILIGTQLSNADLESANLESVIAHDSVFEQCNLKNARFRGGILTNATFREVIAHDSLWADSDLSGSDFTLARAHNANFTNATLSKAVLFGADMRHARFQKASLIAAVMSRMNLFEANLENAVLSDANLAEANLYGAELHGAKIDGSNRKQTNLNATKSVGASQP